MLMTQQPMSQQLHQRQPASAHLRISVFVCTLLATLPLAACGREDSDPAAGGLTVGESEALDRAADRLDSRTPSPARDDAAALEGEVSARLNEKLAEPSKP